MNKQFFTNYFKFIKAGIGSVNHNDLIVAAEDINFWADSKSYNIVEMTHHIWLLAIIDYIIGDIHYSAN
ncbi:MAG: hypothetical protein P8J35_08045 [Candidatus Marinimicrobia bacterium]|nr:hypothetical protein [Candidatus Neomarinimicrobiota bacterium]